MRRRVEHGLIYGDIRMIHDPLAARRRAAIFGLVAVVLIAGGCGLFAWLRPNPDPGSAGILRASDGSLYVRVGEVIHPVTNLTSARLIVGGPDNPQRVGDERLVAMQRGAPLGIASAPSMFAAGDSEDMSWSACVYAGRTTVVAGHAPRQFDNAEGVLVEVGEGETTTQWVLTSAGRASLPPASTPEGRVIRRGLGIDSTTPRLPMRKELLNTFTEAPPLTVPVPLPELLDTGDQAWAIAPNGGIQPVTETQREILTAAGAKVTRILRDQLASYPDAQPPMQIDLPATRPQWIDPKSTAVCASESGASSRLRPEATTGGAMKLPGDAPADYFVGLAAGSVGADTGYGYQVVSATGVRHKVDDRAALETVGAAHVEKVPWAILALLPAGPDLTREVALTAVL